MVFGTKRSYNRGTSLQFGLFLTTTFENLPGKVGRFTERHLARQPSAIHDKSLARYVAAGIARQQQYRADELWRRGPSTQCGGVREFLFFGLGEQAARQIGQEWPRCKAVNRDAVGPQFQCVGPRQAEQCR